MLSFDVRDYGASPSASGEVNTAAWTAAFAAASAAGRGEVVCDVPGTYSWARTDGQNYCVRIPADNLTATFGPGVTIQKADGQESDATGGCSLLRFDDRRNLSINARFATFAGNTAGQPGYTTAMGEQGTRYGQSRASQLIYGTGTATGGGSHNVKIEVGRITDCFSNGVYVTDDNQTIGTNTGINLWVGQQDLCGECVQFQGVSWFGIEVVRSVPSYGITVGDAGAEASHCSDGRIRIHSCVASPAFTDGAFGGGAVVDAYASKRVVVEVGYAKGTVQGVTCQTNFSASEKVCDDITIRGGTFENVLETVAIPAAGLTRIEGVRSINCGVGIGVAETPAIGHAVYVTDSVLSAGQPVIVTVTGACLDLSNTRLLRKNTVQGNTGFTFLSSGTFKMSGGCIDGFVHAFGAYGPGVTPTGSAHCVDVSGCDNRSAESGGGSVAALVFKDMPKYTSESGAGLLMIDCKAAGQGNGFPSPSIDRGVVHSPDASFAGRELLTFAGQMAFKDRAYADFSGDAHWDFLSRPLGGSYATRMRMRANDGAISFPTGHVVPTLGAYTDAEASGLRDGTLLLGSDHGGVVCVMVDGVVTVV